MSSKKLKDISNNVLVESAKLESPYQWDYFSDQPYSIKDKIYKKNIRWRALPANLKLLLINVLFFPFTLLKYFFMTRFLVNRSAVSPKIGLCVNLDKEPELSPDLISDLGVKHLSLRIPLSDITNIDNYLVFANTFKNVEWLFVILQDRQHIEDKVLCENSLHKIFSKFSALGNQFQIGNAINRTKWGFISVDEYLSFFKVAQSVRDKKFPNIDLLGSAVIDFEIYALLRSLWHLFSIKYDGVAALLYVDRRGAPENTQFIFDLVDKINFFWSALSLSPKSLNRLLITETNWPIENTRPYAPALGDVWVNENDYANYMLRYYLFALANGRVECIYWHQLVAPGYGLIDNRDGHIRKRRAYFMFKTLCDFFNNAEVVSIFENENGFELTAKNLERGVFQVAWTKSGSVQKDIPQNMQVYNAVGELQSCASDSIVLTEEPVYFFQES